MGAGKIQDEAEVVRWLTEGRRYAWMVSEYARKYNLQVGTSMFSNFRARKGLQRRTVRNDDLIPWAVNPEHRWAYPLAMLRLEARRAAGRNVKPPDLQRLVAFRTDLEVEGLVVHYDPDTEEGFWLVPRRDGVDNGLIREPQEKTTKRRNASRSH